MSPLPISDYLAGISIGNGTKNAAIYCAIYILCNWQQPAIRLLLVICGAVLREEVAFDCLGTTRQSAFCL
jgi:hypothetical protein